MEGKGIGMDDGTGEILREDAIWLWKELTGRGRGNGQGGYWICGWSTWVKRGGIEPWIRALGIDL